MGNKAQEQKEKILNRLQEGLLFLCRTQWEKQKRITLPTGYIRVHRVASARAHPKASLLQRNSLSELLWLTCQMQTKTMTTQNFLGTHKPTHTGNAQ